MLVAVALICFILWALGLLGGYVLGGLIHLLLAAALVVIVVPFLSGRQVV